VLILGRKLDQSIVIPAHGIEITVTAIGGSRVRLGIAAPTGTAIIRKEIAERYGYEIDDGRVAASADAGDGRAADRTVAGVAPTTADGGGSARVGDAQVG